MGRPPHETPWSANARSMAFFLRLKAPFCFRIVNKTGLEPYRNYLVIFLKNFFKKRLTSRIEGVTLILQVVCMLNIRVQKNSMANNLHNPHFPSLCAVKGFTAQKRRFTGSLQRRSLPPGSPAGFSQTSFSRRVCPLGSAVSIKTPCYFICILIDRSALSSGSYRRACGQKPLTFPLFGK